MKSSSAITKYALFAAAALLPAVCTLAADPPPAPGQPMGPSARRFDWVDHTQQTLSELKGKLNLTAGQMAAWDTWSAGVLNDARAQLARMKDRQEAMGAGARPWAEGPTPERMAKGIERLRAEIQRMQEHLKQLEAAQARTKVFYDQLDTNQKTIFDLFWHEVHHRMAGHADGWHEAE